MGEGAKEHPSCRVPLAMLGSPTQVGDIMKYVKFIQTVTSLPRLDDWAQRFGSSNGSGSQGSRGQAYLWPREVCGIGVRWELSPVFTSSGASAVPGMTTHGSTAVGRGGELEQC